MRPIKNLRSSNGQALLIAVFFFVVVSALVVAAISVPLLRGVNRAGAYTTSIKSFYAGESGAEDVVYRLKVGKRVSAAENVPLGDQVIAVDNNDIGAGNREVIAEGSIDNRVRKVRYVLRVGEGATFSFGVQTDTGGIIMENSSSINGNAFSNGTIVGSGNNLVNGDAISAGAGGLMRGIHTTGAGYAHSIEDSTIDGDAYYFSSDTISNTTVGGVSYPDSADQATSSLPITDEQIETWKTDAESGGVTPCPEGQTEIVINTSQTIGPHKFACNLTIKNNPTITLAGAVWIEGNMTLENNVSYVVDPALEGESIPIVADNPLNRETSSQIDFRNSGFFDGAGQGSYIVLISQNESAENGGSNYAIRVTNGASGDVLVYAGHGEILLQNNIDLKEVTAYQVRLQNSAEVTYESGLANLLFTSGPSGGFHLDSWEEIE
jgi:hypothetical protein